MTDFYERLAPITGQQMDLHVILAMPSSSKHGHFILIEEFGIGDEAEVNSIGLVTEYQFELLCKVIGGEQTKTVNTQGVVRVEIKYD